MTRPLERDARVRYIGKTAYLRGHTGIVTYAAPWSDRVEVEWDLPHPRGGRYMNLVGWSAIARTNLARIDVSHSHLSWTA